MVQGHFSSSSDLQKNTPSLELMRGPLWRLFLIMESTLTIYIE